MGGAGLIADTSVLIVYARAQRLDVLLRTLREVSLTKDVREEAIEAAPDRRDSQALADAIRRGRISVAAVRPARVAALRRRYPNLGRGEASVIAAAIQNRDRTVLLDERAARRAAALEGLQAVGSLGVLARARRRGVLKSHREVADVLRDLLSVGLWVAPDVVEAFWQGIGGRP
jgi:predicted nucleic acid-binding protein